MEKEPGLDTYLLKCAEQRAFLFRLVKELLEDGDNEYPSNVKELCIYTFMDILKHGSATHDEIEEDIFRKIKSLCEQEIALEEVKDIIAS